MFASLKLPELLRSAREDDEVFLPRLEPGWQGAVLAVVGAVLGEGWALLTKMGQEPTASSAASTGAAMGGLGADLAARAGPALGWLALILIFVGLLIQLCTWRVRGGWRLRVSAGELTPEGLAGEPLRLGSPQGYALCCVAGDRFRSVAIDLRHEERGRIARIYQTPARTSMKNIQACCELTDVLALRLGVAREGLRV
ncbi:MAG: hypothetical protein RL584_1328 [Pseudomonadota bacterium]|jgi:hypothetical protein